MHIHSTQEVLTTVVAINVDVVSNQHAAVYIHWLIANDTRQ